MATLIENIAKTKENFRNIRKAINDVGDVAGFNNLTTEPVEEYPTRLNEAVDLYGLSKYEDGYADGKADGGGGVDLSKCKYIPKQATGKVISLNDVSEVYHKVKVYGDGEVDVYGKNLFDENTNNWGTYYASDKSRIGFEIPHGLSTITMSVNLKSGYEPQSVNMSLYREDGDGVYTQLSGKIFSDSATMQTYTLDATKKYLFICLSTTTPSVLATLIDTYDWQLEVGSVATPYEPYNKQTITATPNGAEANSICPNMAFISDSDITVDYYSSFGMKTECDRFWDNFQQNGNATSYSIAFSTVGWNDITFRPKYDLIVKNAYQMFYNCGITDLVGILKRCGVTIQWGQNNGLNFGYAFNSPNLTTVPETNLSTATSDSNTNRTFSGANIVSIEKIISSENTVFNVNAFNNATSLVSCIFSGIIANDINLQWSKLLDEESLVSLAVTLAHFLTTEMNPEGSNIEQGQVWTRTITLSPESWAILDNTPYPDAPMMSCTEFITTVKAWNKA